MCCIEQCKSITGSLIKFMCGRPDCKFRAFSNKSIGSKLCSGSLITKNKVFRRCLHGIEITIVKHFLCECNTLRKCTVNDKLRKCFLHIIHRRSVTFLDNIERCKRSDTCLLFSILFGFLLYRNRRNELVMLCFLVISILDNCIDYLSYRFPQTVIKSAVL